LIIQFVIKLKLQSEDVPRKSKMHQSKLMDGAEKDTTQCRTYRQRFCQKCDACFHNACQGLFENDSIHLIVAYTLYWVLTMLIIRVGWLQPEIDSFLDHVVAIIVKKGANRHFELGYCTYFG